MISLSSPHARPPGKRVVERPIAVDEAEPDATVIAAQQPVSGMEALDEGPNAIDERPFALGVMMQMHLDVRETHVGQSCQRVDRGRVILLFRIEEGVTGRLTRGVCVPPRDSRPAPRPSLHALERRSIVRAPPPRLEMIGNRDPDSCDRGSLPVGDVVQSGRHVSGQPQRERAQGRETCRSHRISATGVVTRPTIGGAGSTGAPACGPVPPWRAAAIRAVGVQTIDCAPRRKVSNPRRSARFIERK